MKSSPGRNTGRGPGGRGVLIDLVGEDEQHPLASLMEVIGTLIERYEDEHVPELQA